MAQDHQDDTRSAFRHPRAAGTSPSIRRDAADPREWTTPRHGAARSVGHAGPADGLSEPVVDGAHPDEAAAIASTRSARRVALIVDREPLIRLLLRAVLTRQGWHVIDASDPAESFAKLDRHRPGLLVIDPTPRQEPDVDLVARIRSRRPVASIVVVSDDPQAEGIARQLGARFIPKPFAILDFAMFVGSVSEGDAQPAHFTGSANDLRPAAATPHDLTFRTTSEALTAWRAAERRLEDAVERGPLRTRLESDVVRCRDAYVRLIDRKTRLRGASW